MTNSMLPLAREVRDFAAKLNRAVPDIVGQMRLDAAYIGRKLDRLADELGDTRPHSCKENVWQETLKYFDDLLAADKRRRSG